MLLRLFKGYQAFLLLFIPLLAILLWLNTFFIKEIEIDGQYVFMPLSKLVFNLFGYNTFFSKFFALALLFLNAILLVRINISYNFIRARTYLPAVIYIFLLSHVSEIQRLTPALMASTFIILSINKVLFSFKKEKLAIQIMDASLLMSVASMFYFPAVFLITYIWIGLLLLRQFRWREWIFTVLGMIIPYIIYACILYISGNKIKIPFSLLYNVPFILNWDINDNLISLFFFGYITILIILASFQMIKLFGTKKAHSRKFFIYFLWLFILTVFIYLIVPGAAIEILYIVAVSLSFLFAHYFINLKSFWISEILFLILVSIIIVNKFIG